MKIMEKKIMEMKRRLAVSNRLRVLHSTACKRAEHSGALPRRVSRRVGPEFGRSV
jgi:hypothetical protein